MRSARLTAFSLLTLLCADGVRAGAQGNCNVNNQANCAVTTFTISLTIEQAARFTTPNTSITIPAANVAEFEAGFGAAHSAPLSVRSNSGWTATIRATSPTWTATPPSAWQSKPASDLQWGLSSSGPFTDVTTTAASIQSGVATGNATIPLHLRVRWAYASDAPGNYSLPIEVVLSAP